jgi:hypothetical protein
LAGAHARRRGIDTNVGFSCWDACTGDAATSYDNIQLHRRGADTNTDNTDASDSVTSDVSCNNIELYRCADANAYNSDASGDGFTTSDGAASDTDADATDTTADTTDADADTTDADADADTGNTNGNADDTNSEAYATDAIADATDASADNEISHTVSY